MPGLSRIAIVDIIILTATPTAWKTFNVNYLAMRSMVSHGRVRDAFASDDSGLDPHTGAGTYVIPRGHNNKVSGESTKTKVGCLRS